MAWKNSPERYGHVARFWHWLVLLLLLGSFPLGYTMSDMAQSPLKLKLVSWHKWIGVTILMVMILRLVWRLYVAPPELPATMPRWEREAAGIVHRMLYLVLLAMPFTGWLMSSAMGIPVVYLGLVRLPDLVAKNKPLGAALVQVHATLAVMLLTLIGLHVLAALKHQFRDRDGVLARMLPGVKPPSGSGT